MTVVQPRLCLVEDDEIMGESLCDRFDLDGYACDWHKTASSAMASLERTHYAAVISDVRLPDLTGDEMFARLNRGQRRRCRRSFSSPPSAPSTLPSGL